MVTTDPLTCEHDWTVGSKAVYPGGHVCRLCGLPRYGSDRAIYLEEQLRLVADALAECLGTEQARGLYELGSRAEFGADKEAEPRAEAIIAHASEVLVRARRLQGGGTP